MANVVSI